MFKPTYKICCNCGTAAPLRKRLCTGCGKWTRAERRAGFKSIWRAPTVEEIDAHTATTERLNTLLAQLLS